ncbi:aldose 1-epimerase family protein [Mobiluncus mulieris]|uniref:Aldose 1-epimerase n=2 Tax=Mobiluncus mulieris TaxID=2052 RepID=E0QQI8_9ACTO|nr:aldose 1-epimerase family protein [Mobiluncus mulieris]EEZ90537.1 hypothetical protein HMPREF0578_2374 [Mobiluncus mulieris 28-1]EFM46161.1 hypothetical protein HMPREF0580_1153 [Mobiluncus mulieris ATCC 35239]MCU9969716.1 DUF4432 family protein [Mobiluncus mulieris]MCU9971665.1 DUF4432 family protein [Mobiluncus mulieris]MCU9974102.1 DUF4432 family protein [Mobiluncus mulieris]
MNFEMALPRALFTENTVEVLHADKWSVVAKKYLSGIDSLTINNDKGYVEVLPFMGQIIWDASFNGKSLRMTNMFPEPKPAALIEDTYGCFAFHSGLLAAGCPSPEDTHPLHGEFSCAPMDSARLIVTDSAVKVESSREYLKGFGDHYLAKPSVTLREGSSMFDIHLQVTNLSKYAPMPLQYMCHMNYAFVPGGIMSQNLPDGAFQLRRSIPAHVKPTPQWIQLNEDIIAGKKDANSLVGAEEYDPEIVFFADGVNKHTDYAVFNLKAPDGTVFQTEFDTADFPVVTRWILHNADQKVAAFALPGTSRPEGRLAAQKAGTLIQLAAGETREFNVHTGVKED